MRAFIVVGFLLLIGQTVRAESDVLLQAVSFAITGSDGANVIQIDRANCVFRIEDETFYFNNIQSNRLSIQTGKDIRRPAFGAPIIEQWATVDIHGEKKVADVYSPGIQFTGSELDRAALAADPSFFAKRGPTVTPRYDLSIRVNTREPNRLLKAWKYIYAHGCKGVVSPF